MKQLIFASAVLGVIAFSGCTEQPANGPAGAPATAGPNGGDLVPITLTGGGDPAWAELLANADTGELAVYTWDEDLESKQPIEEEPLVVGSGDNSVELMPHPAESDPSGRSSRFYGQAEWVKGGDIQHGWMHRDGAQDHREFDWERCWQAGRRHGPMWSEMREHHGMRHMGGMRGRHGPGHRTEPGTGPGSGTGGPTEHGPDPQREQHQQNE